MKVRTFKSDVSKVEAAVETLEGLAGQIEQVAWILEGIQETDETTTAHDRFISCVNDETEELQILKDSLDAISSALLKLCSKHSAIAEIETNNVMRDAIAHLVKICEE